jgi:SAM-dependent methyltransferase
MADLSQLASGSFDLVFHPVSNCVVTDVRPVWRESVRVLRSGGRLLAGFLNPVACMSIWMKSIAITCRCTIRFRMRIGAIYPLSVVPNFRLKVSRWNSVTR